MNQFGVLRALLVFSIIFTILSCSSSKKQPISYLGLKNDTTGLSEIKTEERIIQKGDLISIVVYSDNPAATAIYNQPILHPSSSSINDAGVSTQSPGYLVNDFGYIQFQSLGNIHVQGLTKQQLSDTLVSKLRKFLSNPYCSIRLLNYKITVMGEVVKPNSYYITNEQINVLEAIGMAGDVTLYGKKDNVMVVREVNGKRTIGVLDLRDPNIFKSEYYYLQQNDLIIVDQLKNKQQASDQVTVRNISIFATIISTLAIVFSAVSN